MSLGTEAAIFDALMARMAAFSHSPAIEIAYPGLSFTPSDGEPYLEVTHLPNNTAPLAVASDGVQQHQGLLQVSVMWPSDGVTGHMPALELADAVSTHFAKGTDLYSNGVKVRIPTRPSIASPLQEPDRVRLPITIEYIAFV